MLNVPHLDQDKPQSGCGTFFVREIAVPLAAPLAIAMPASALREAVEIVSPPGNERVVE